jgi:hypothetical protein
MSEIEPILGVADHLCYAPIAEPIMKKASVTGMRLLPPPAV